MGSFFGWMSKVFRVLADGVKKVFDDPDAAIDRALTIAQVPSDIVAFALPYAKMFAPLTPTPLDDIALGVLDKLNLKLQEVLDEPDHDKRAMLIRKVVVESTKERVRQLVAGAAGQKIKFGKISIRVPADVDKIATKLFNLAAETAYVLFVAPHDPKQLNEPDLQPALTPAA